MARPPYSPLRPLLNTPASLTRRAFPIRQASTSAPSLPRRFLSTTILLGSGVALVAYYYDSRSILHEKVAMPIMRLLDPETGHKLAVRLLSQGSWARPKDRGVDGPELEADLFGLPLSNPVGMAAGFDKDAECIDGLFDLGFGYVEVGSVTPESQPGNPKPRFFRLVEDDSSINRYGFNSFGHAYTLQNLRTRLVHFSRSRPSLFPSPLPHNPLPPPDLPRSLRPGHILAVNLGKNKTSPADSNDDYIRGVRTLGPYADVLVVNVSSPNTPGLRALQGREVLERLLRDVVLERDQIQVGGLPKVAVKVACDLNEEELGDVAWAVRNSGVEGVIVSNTTIRREGLGLVSPNQKEVGGLSGPPLFPLALKALRTLRPLLPPHIPIIGCGGVTTSHDALAMARSGASIVQLYTSFGYRGVGTPRLLKDEISQQLRVGGTSWKGQVGKEVGKWDERKVVEEGERVRREVEALAGMLRELDEEEGLRGLMREAEEALKRGGPAAPRDNALGAEGEPRPAPTPSIGERGQGLVEDAGSDEAGPFLLAASAITRGIAQLIEPSRPEAVVVVVEPEGNDGAGQEASRPTGVDLRPVFVGDTPLGAAEEEDPWVREARSGQRRLV